MVNEEILSTNIIWTRKFLEKETINLAEQMYLEDGEKKKLLNWFEEGSWELGKNQYVG